MRDSSYVVFDKNENQEEEIVLNDKTSEEVISSIKNLNP